MDLTPVIQVVTQLGAMGILAIIVFRSPQILTALTAHIQTVVENVRGTQSEALKVFQAEMEKVITIMDSRLSAVESNTSKMVSSLTEMCVEMKGMSERVGVLERGIASK